MDSLVYQSSNVAVASGVPLSLEEPKSFPERDAFARATSATQSGLPLAWGADGPVRPQMTMSRRLSLVGKRLFDIVAASAGVIVLAPMFLIIAIAIVTTSRGPVFFRQQREGIDGSRFWVFKFRSMSIEHCDPSGVAQTKRNDPRVTAIGRFIRRTSIDELPQLLNVILGDMSLVGPRPHVPGMLAGGVDYRTLVPYYDARLAMRPGITGWAQANGLRGPTADIGAARRRVDHDIAYIQNFSLWLDAKVLVKTVAREFLSGSGD